ncbi:MAG: AMP-binding protein, partial [Stellaceae bacterium]
MNRFLVAIDRHVRERPDDVFCHFIKAGRTRAITWRDLGRGVGGFATAYRARRLRPGAVVAIFLRHDPAIYAALFAAMAQGLIPTILASPSPRQDPAIYWDALRRLLTHLDPAAIVVARQSIDEMRAAGLAIDAARAILVKEVPRTGARPTHAPGEDAIALVQHSSGTTGARKGVALTYRAIAAQLDAYGAALRLEATDRIVSWLPLYHDMGLIACLLLPAYFGIPFAHLDAFEWVARPELLFAAIEAHRGTLVWQPDFAFAHLAARAPDSPRHDLSSIRAFINCAEPCRAESFAGFLDRFAASGVRREMLHSCYAMAESVFAVSQTALGSGPRTRMSGAPKRPAMALGRPIADIEVSVRRRDG